MVLQCILSYYSTLIVMNRPHPTEYAQGAYFSRYIDQVGDRPILEVLTSQLEEVQQIFGSLGEDQSHFQYEAGKWSLKELLGHLIDTERIMAYRVLCIARGEKQPLPGFDENSYVAAAQFYNRSLHDLLHEYQLVRKANVALFGSLTENMLLQMGNANGKEISARAIIYIIAGHERHHLGIIRERYLPKLQLDS